MAAPPETGNRTFVAYNGSMLEFHESLDLRPNSFLISFHFNAIRAGFHGDLSGRFFQELNGAD